MSATKRQIIFASPKGGVGKSYAARMFLDSARRGGRRVSAWDLDGATGSLASLYADENPEVGAGREDVRSARAKGAWLDALHGPADDVMLDVPGGALDDLERIVTGGAPSLVAEARDAKRDLVIVSVIGIKRDATGGPHDAIERFAPEPGVHHVVLKNGLFGDVADFVIFDGIPADSSASTPQERKFGRMSDLVRKVGGEIVYLPKLNPLTDALLDVEGLTFVEGINAVGTLGRRHTSSLRAWLKSSEEALAGTWLSPLGDVPSEKLAPRTNGVRYAAVVG